MTEPEFHAPIWDRGEPIDAEMLAFTVGDDPLWDRRLVVHDLRGSMAHAAGLLRAKLITAEDDELLQRGLTELLETHLAGEWTVEPTDEDVHSAVERRLIALIGDAGEKLHTGRSRNDQVAVDVRLWLREAVAEMQAALSGVREACVQFGEQHGQHALPGYTHMRRAMPSSIADWIGAHARAFEFDAAELEHATGRIAECPLGSGAGYGTPLELDREFVARELGFERPEQPVTYTQHSRGRPELAYLTALESIALSLGKLAADLWLYSTTEFGFVRLPVAFTTGSSMMPHKRNPDAIELTRAHCRALISERAALLELLRDQPSGYHRDFQLLKPPMFRAHDRALVMLKLWARLLEGLELDEAALAEASADDSLHSTRRALEQVQSGVAFRQAYRAESKAHSTDT